MSADSASVVRTHDMDPISLIIMKDFFSENNLWLSLFMSL